MKLRLLAEFLFVLLAEFLLVAVFLQGYKVVTGTLRESMMGLVVTTLKAVFIVGLALGFGKANDTFSTFLVNDMPSGINYMITGKDELPSEAIDSNLGWMQVAMSSMDALDAGTDPAGNSEKERANTWIGLGTGGPAITAGALLLMYQVAIALFVGLGPLFILCLLFDSTKSLFQQWLFYGIGTMFSMAVLSAMVSIALAMVTDVAAAMWATEAINRLILDTNGTGYSSRALQTGSMGMILTLLLITVPPMAASFFSGTLGQFGWGNAFQSAGASRRDGLGPSGQAPGTPGYIPDAGGGGGRRPRGDSGETDAGRQRSGFNDPSTSYGARVSGSGTGQQSPQYNPGSRGNAGTAQDNPALQAYQQGQYGGGQSAPTTGARGVAQTGGTTPSETRIVQDSPPAQPQGAIDVRPPPKDRG